MPVETPWIRTYDFPGEYTKGYGLGLEGAKAQASLQQQANEMAQRAAMQSEQLAARQAEIELETKTRKEIAEKNLLAEQARADITAAYHQAQIGIQKQRLEESARLMDFKIKQAARQVGVVEAYTQKTQENLAAGMDESMARIRAGMDVPGFARHAGDLAALGGAEARLSNLPANVPGGVKAKRLQFEEGGYVPDTFLITGRGGRDVVRTIPGAASATSSELATLKSREIAINKILDSPTTASMEKLDPNSASNSRGKQYILDYQSRIKAWREELSEIKRQRREIQGKYLTPGEGRAGAEYTWDAKAGKIVKVAP